MAKKNPTSIRLTDEEKQLLSLVQKDLNDISENDVFKFLLKQYAKDHNIRLKGRYYQPLRLHPRFEDYYGVTSDGRNVVVKPSENSEDIDLPDKNDDTDWWADRYSRFPMEYEYSILIYCAVCGDCPQMEDSDNIGEGQHCTCNCHETGIALPVQEEK